MSEIHFPNTKSKAVFNAEGPRPQFICDTPTFKALIVGLEAGQQLPPHPAETAIYHFLEGAGSMTVDGETFAIEPGATIVAPGGATRGIKATQRTIFLAAKGGE